uniref:Uncharacterized protein n=1 Tax=Ditylenchus dipsaci TaxID=166011 RepID=A0A915D8J4_9BILA
MIDRSNRENDAAEQPVAGSSSSSSSYHPRYLQRTSITQDSGAEATVFYEVKSSRRRYQKKMPINKEQEAEKSIIPHSSASRFAMARQSKI